MPEGENDRQCLAEDLPIYRDELQRRGMSKEDIDVALRMTWTEPPVIIHTVEDYRRAVGLYGEMSKQVRNGDWRSPAAIRLHALGGEILRFQQDHKHIPLPTADTP
jgi:hypothetical protein